MKRLRKPKSQIEEVLYFLYNRKNIDVVQMAISCSVSDLRKQISILRNKYQVPIASNRIRQFNKFGNIVTLCEYSIIDKKIGYTVYSKIQETRLKRQKKI